MSGRLVSGGGVDTPIHPSQLSKALIEKICFVICFCREWNGTWTPVDSCNERAALVCGFRNDDATSERYRRGKAVKKNLECNHYKNWPPFSFLFLFLNCRRRWPRGIANALSTDLLFSVSEAVWVVPKSYTISRSVLFFSSSYTHLRIKILTLASFFLLWQGDPEAKQCSIM